MNFRQEVGELPPAVKNDVKGHNRKGLICPSVCVCVPMMTTFMRYFSMDQHPLCVT